jgi:AbrB family looped-hinge helix DNA binding protein
MATLYTSISSKGQLVIPAELREEMNLSAGTKVSIRREGNALVDRPITPEFIDPGWVDQGRRCRARAHAPERRKAMIYVLDASAILRFTDKEPGFERVRELFYEAAEGSAQLLLSSVNWGEIVAVLYKKDSRRAEGIQANLAALLMTIVPVDAIAAAEAGSLNGVLTSPTPTLSPEHSP